MTKKIIGYKSIAYVQSLSDPGVISLGKLSEAIRSLLLQYPPETLLEFDAGYNNISCDIVEPIYEPPKKRKKKMVTISKQEYDYLIQLQNNTAGEEPF